MDKMMKTNELIREPEMLVTDSRLDKVLQAKNQLPPKEKRQAVLLEELSQIKKKKRRGVRKKGCFFLT